MKKVIIILFILVGIGLFFGGIKLQESIDKFMESAIETVGIIEDVEKETVREKDISTGEITYKTSYHVTIIYTDNIGNKHTKIMETSSNSYYEGDEIAIFYNPENPRDAKTKSDENAGKIMSIFGIGFTIVSVAILVTDIKLKRRDSQNNIQTTNF